MWYWTWICLIRCCSKVGVWYRGVFVWLGCGLSTWLLFRLFEMGAREGERGRRVLYLETRDQVEAEGATSPPISPPPNWKVFFLSSKLSDLRNKKKNARQDNYSRSKRIRTWRYEKWWVTKKSFMGTIIIHQIITIHTIRNWIPILISDTKFRTWNFGCEISEVKSRTWNLGHSVDNLGQT